MLIWNFHTNKLQQTYKETSFLLQKNQSISLWFKQKLSLLKEKKLLYENNTDVIFQ